METLFLAQIEQVVEAVEPVQWEVMVHHHLRQVVVTVAQGWLLLFLGRQ
jgi:hypothetical protein